MDLGPLQVKIGRMLLPDLTWSGDTRGSRVALTFDDGPDPIHTPALLDRLRNLRIPAHFFVLGERIDRPGGLEIVGRAIDEGHGVGLHGDRHRRWLGRKTGAVIEELDRLRDKLAISTDRDPSRFCTVRPPFGLIGPGQARRIAEAGYRVVVCDVLPGDWAAPGPVVVDRVLNRARPGSIVALHDVGLGGLNAPETVSAIVEAWKGRGLRPAPLLELIGGCSNEHLK